MSETDDLKKLERAVSKSVEFMAWVGSHVGKWVVIANTIGSVMIIIMGLIMRFGSKKELTTLQKKSCNFAFMFGGITLTGVIVIWIMKAIKDPTALVIAIFLLTLLFFLRQFLILIWIYVRKNLPDTGVSLGLNIITTTLCLPDLLFAACLLSVLLIVIVISLTGLIVPIIDPDLVRPTIDTLLHTNTSSR